MSASERTRPEGLAGSARHRPDVVSLVSGALFLAAALLFGLTPGGDGLPGARWYLPALLIVAGVLGLVTSLVRRPADRS